MVEPAGHLPDPPRHRAGVGATRRIAWRALACVALIGLAAACGTSGRTMQAPIPGATAPPRHPDATTATTTAAQNTAVSTDLFTLTSSAFSPGGEIPAEATCDGAGHAPAFTWANVPAGTVELAVVITDPDAGDHVHWVITHVDPATTSLGPGTAPIGTVQLHNSGGTASYEPLCPPAGATHTYDFTLYALTSPSGLTAASDTTAALTQLATTAAGTAVLTGYYTRNTAN